VVAIDADISQHLAEALGAARDPLPMGAYLAEIKECLGGSNPRISSAGGQDRVHTTGLHGPFTVAPHPWAGAEI
jgi:hypothetical protein